MIKAATTNSILEAIVRFVRFARATGMNIGFVETQDALKIADEGLLLSRDAYRMALKTLFCTSPEERQLFDQLFRRFWEEANTETEQQSNSQHLSESVQQKNNFGLLTASGVDFSEKKESEFLEESTGASNHERLRKIDFSKLVATDAAALEELAKRLGREMAIRMRRKMQASTAVGSIHLRRTLRGSITYGGELLDLYYRKLQPKKQRLIVLLDVSGSMDKYSYYLLRFVSEVRRHIRQLEAFVFSTSLIRITDAMNSNYLTTIMSAVSNKVDNWSGGTKIGECLEQFNDQYGKRLLNGSPITIILSDGLETGDPTLLQQQMEKIRLRSKKIIWLNPLKGNSNYQPLAKGMQAVLQTLDHFAPAHNLASLLELERLLLR
jgi:hypothetical protein